MTIDEWNKKYPIGTRALNTLVSKMAYQEVITIGKAFSGRLDIPVVNTDYMEGVPIPLSHLKIIEAPTPEKGFIEQKYLKKLSDLDAEINDRLDKDKLHEKYDEVLTDILTELGFTELVKQYKKPEKWYA